MDDKFLGSAQDLRNTPEQMIDNASHQQEYASLWHESRTDRVARVKNVAAQIMSNRIFSIVRIDVVGINQPDLCEEG